MKTKKFVLILSIMASMFIGLLTSCSNEPKTDILPEFNFIFFEEDESTREAIEREIRTYETEYGESWSFDEFDGAETFYCFDNLEGFITRNIRITSGAVFYQFSCETTISIIRTDIKAGSVQTFDEMVKSESGNPGTIYYAEDNALYIPFAKIITMPFNDTFIAVQAPQNSSMADSSHVAENFTDYETFRNFVHRVIDTAELVDVQYELSKIN